MQILISEKKFSVVFLHQEFQLNLELFHTSIINKIKQKLRKKKKPIRLAAERAKTFYRDLYSIMPRGVMSGKS